MHACASPREKNLQERNVFFRRGISEKAINEEAPCTQAAHVHERTKGSQARDRIRNCSCDENGKLVGEMGEAKGVAGKLKGMSLDLDQPLVQALLLSDELENCDEAGVRARTGAG